MNRIRDRLARLRETIASTAVAAGRRPEDISLIAVSKLHPAAAIEQAAAAGQNAFGESTVQEAIDKIARLGNRHLEWHFIGHLQSNKTKFIPRNFAWLHSLDSFKLAQRLSRQLEEADAHLDVLIEVNVAADPRKHGLPPHQLAPLVEQLLAADLRCIRLRGLMTIAPFPAEESEVRKAFSALRVLRDDCRERYALPSFAELSMGMSGDYVEAIKEGSTMVRIGSAIFGERDYA